MKKIITVLILMLMSISMTFAQGEWSDYEIPGAASSTAVTEQSIYVFSADRLFQVDLPLPRSGQPLSWSENILPGTGSVKASIVTTDNHVFILRDGDLFRWSYCQWEQLFQNIEGMTGIRGDHFFWWSANEIYEYHNGVTTYRSFDGTQAIAFSDNHVTVFTEQGNYSGPDINNICLTGVIPHLSIKEAAMTSTEYIAVGDVTGNLAAWHQSPLDTCADYTHILTTGTLFSVAVANDVPWVAGCIGQSGVIFNTVDMSSIMIVPEVVRQIRSNESGLLVALSEHRLYVCGSSTTTGIMSPSIQSDLRIFPNPVKDGNIYIISPTERQARLFNLRGQQIDTVLLVPGKNIVNVSYLPSGVYLLEGDKIIVP